MTVMAGDRFPIHSNLEGVGALPDDTAFDQQNPNPLLHISGAWFGSLVGLPVNFFSLSTLLFFFLITLDTKEIALGL